MLVMRFIFPVFAFFIFFEAAQESSQILSLSLLQASASSSPLPPPNSGNSGDPSLNRAMEKELKDQKEEEKQKKKEEKQKKKEEKQKEKEEKQRAKKERRKAKKGKQKEEEKPQQIPKPDEEPEGVCRERCSSDGSEYGTEAGVDRRQIPCSERLQHIRFTPPQRVVLGPHSSIPLLPPDLRELLRMEETKISLFSDGISVFNIRMTPSTKMEIKVRDTTIDLDMKYTKEVLTVMESLPTERNCSKDLTNGIGSLLVSLQGKNDALAAKILLIGKLLRNSNDSSNTKEVLELQSSIANHREVFQARKELIEDLSTILIVCYKRFNIPKEVGCVINSDFVDLTKTCSSKDLFGYLERNLENHVMRFLENSYHQSCSDVNPSCKELCYKGDASCLKCFTYSLCERSHLLKKHFFGQQIVKFTTLAYECENYLAKEMIKADLN
ncbi:signal peptide containing protein [Cryptosporidium felis]|nr:signal peptide containing protein [Cryptosporidium felis]